MSILRKILHFLLIGFFSGLWVNDAFAVQIGSGYQVSLFQPGTNKTWTLLKAKDGSGDIIDVSNIVPQLKTDANGNQYIEYVIGPSCGGTTYQSTGDIMKDNQASWEAVKKFGRDHSTNPYELLKGEEASIFGQGEFQIIDNCNGGKVIASGTIDPNTGKVTYSDGFNPSTANQAGQDLILSQNGNQTPVTVGENGELMDSYGNVMNTDTQSECLSCEKNVSQLDNILTFALVSFIGDFLGRCIASSAEVRYSPEICAFKITNGKNNISLSDMSDLTAGVQRLNFLRNKIYNTLVANQFYVSNSFMLSIIDEYSALLSTQKDKFAIRELQNEFIKQLFNDQNRRKFAIFQSFLVSDKEKIQHDIKIVIDAISESYEFIYESNQTGSKSELANVVADSIARINPFKKGVTSFVRIIKKGFENTNIVHTGRMIEGFGKNLVKGISDMINDPKAFKEALRGNRKQGIYNIEAVNSEMYVPEIAGEILGSFTTMGIASCAFAVNPLLALAVFIGDGVIKQNLSGVNAVDVIKKNLSSLKQIILNERQKDTLAKMFKGVAKELNGIKGRTESVLIRSYIKQHIITRYFDYINHNIKTGKSIHVLTEDFKKQIENLYKTVIDQHRKAFSKRHFKKEYSLFTKKGLNVIDKGLLGYLKRFVTWNGIIFNYLCNANAVEQIYADVCRLRKIDQKTYKKQSAGQKVKSWFSNLKKGAVKTNVVAGEKLSIGQYLDLVAYRSKDLNLIPEISKEKHYFTSTITLNNIEGAKAKISDIEHYVRYKNLFNAVSDTNNFTDRSMYFELKEVTDGITEGQVVIDNFEPKVGIAPVNELGTDNNRNFTHEKIANDNVAVHTGLKSTNIAIDRGEEHRGHLLESTHKKTTPNSVNSVKKKESSQKRSLKNIFKRQTKPRIILQEIDSAKRILLLYAALGEYISYSPQI